MKYNVISDKLKYITIFLSFVVLILGSLAIWHGNIEKNFDLRTAIVNSDSIDLLFFACITFIFVGTAILNFFLKYRKAICIVALFFIGMAAGLLNWFFSSGINEKIVFVSQSEIIVAIIGFIVLLGIIPVYRSNHPKKAHSPINWSIVATWVIGIVGALIMGFGMSKIMVGNATRVDFIVGLIAGVIGLLICVLNYPIYGIKELPNVLRLCDNKKVAKESVQIMKRIIRRYLLRKRV